MSFFARWTWGWSTTLTNIDDHIRSSKAGFEEIDLCNSSNALALLYAFFKFIFNILEYFKEHLLKLIYTIMLIGITISIVINISSISPNKVPLIFFVALTSITGVIMVITSVIRHFELNKSTNTDSSSLGATATQTPINP
tara:strand:- start:203 stop:622 length:420 start_codon:yes stop_codon:yes gene_type:complete